MSLIIKSIPVDYIKLYADYVALCDSKVQNAFYCIDSSYDVNEYTTIKAQYPLKVNSFIYYAFYPFLSEVKIAGQPNVWIPKCMHEHNGDDQIVFENKIIDQCTMSWTTSCVSCSNLWDHPNTTQFHKTFIMDFFKPESVISKEYTMAFDKAHQLLNPKNTTKNRYILVNIPSYLRSNAAIKCIKQYDNPNDDLPTERQFMLFTNKTTSSLVMNEKAFFFGLIFPPPSCSNRYNSLYSSNNCPRIIEYVCMHGVGGNLFQIMFNLNHFIPQMGFNIKCDPCFYLLCMRYDLKPQDLYIVENYSDYSTHKNKMIIKSEKTILQDVPTIILISDDEDDNISMSTTSQPMVSSTTRDKSPREVIDIECSELARFTELSKPRQPEPIAGCSHNFSESETIDINRTTQISQTAQTSTPLASPRRHVLNIECSVLDRFSPVSIPQQPEPNSGCSYATPLSIPQQQPEGVANCSNALSSGGGHKRPGSQENANVTKRSKKKRDKLTIAKFIKKLQVLESDNRDLSVEQTFQLITQSAIDATKYGRSKKLEMINNLANYVKEEDSDYVEQTSSDRNMDVTVNALSPTYVLRKSNRAKRQTKFYQAVITPQNPRARVSRAIVECPHDQEEFAEVTISNNDMMDNDMTVNEQGLHDRIDGIQGFFDEWIRQGIAMYEAFMLKQ